LQDLEFDGEDVLGQETGKIELPVYLNSTREDLLFTVDLPVQPVRIFRFYQQCCASGMLIHPTKQGEEKIN
jgi:hypothetical protein